MSSPQLPGIPKSLADSLLNTRLVLFAGAGLSKPAGAPGWRDLLKLVIARFHQEYAVVEYERELVQMIDRGGSKDLLVVADRLQSARKDLVQACIREVCERLTPGSAHESIAKLHWAGIVTPNYDSLIEMAFHRCRNESLHTILPGQLEKQQRLDDLAPWILKLHGGVDDLGNTALSWSDYRQLAAGDPALYATLSRLFQSYTFFFAGFGLEDPDSMDVLSNLSTIFHGEGRVHYALVEEKSLGEVRSQQLWQEFRVQAIKYSAVDDAHSEVSAYLSSLLDLQAASQAARMSKMVFVMRGLSNPPNVEPMLLVTNSNPQWRLPSSESGGVSETSAHAYLLPSLNDIGGGAEAIRHDLSAYLDIPEAELDVNVNPDLFETRKYNPALGRETAYRFRFIEVSFKQPNSKLENAPLHIGGRTFDWRSVLELRTHLPTMKLNGDVLTELCRRYGGGLERAALSVKAPIGRQIDPYEFRSRFYDSLPWVRDEEMFQRILRPADLGNAPGVLDLGCGPGILGQYMLEKTNLAYAGFDYSAPMVEQARRALPSPRCKVDLIDIVHGMSDTKYDGWLFVMKNVMHLIPRLYGCFSTMATRFGQPLRLRIVETVSPSLAALVWVQTLFERLGLLYKRQWFIRDQLPMMFRQWGCKMESEEHVEQFIDVDKWLNSFAVDDAQKNSLTSYVDGMPSDVRRDMKFDVDANGVRRMLRLQYVSSIQLQSTHDVICV